MGEEELTVVPREELMFLRCKKCLLPIVFRPHISYTRFVGSCCNFVWDAVPMDDALRFFKLISNLIDPKNVIKIYPKRLTCVPSN